MSATVNEQIRAAEHIKYALGLLTEPEQVVELRIPKAGGRTNRTDSGYFGAPEKLVAAAQRYNGRDTAYITLNPVNPRFLPALRTGCASTPDHDKRRGHCAPAVVTYRR